MRLIASLLVTLFAAASVRAGTITVSAAISLKESLEGIGKVYEAKTGDHVTFNFDASGKLAQQIRQGAPVDAFISADNDQVNKLVESGDADKSTRRLVARNTLVLVVPADAVNPAKSFADLATGQGKIAIGDPHSVPAGRYAEQTFRSLKIYDAVAPRLVFGENVRQVLTYVQRGEVDAGVVYGTDAKVAGATVKFIATADTSTHDSIEYPAVILTHSARVAAAQKFVDYLTSEPSRAALARQGFELPAPESPPTTRPAQ